MGQGWRQEAVTVALLFAISTFSRTHVLFLPLHDARVTVLHVTEQVLGCLVQLAIAASTEEGYPKMLFRMAIGSGGVLIHHATIQAESYLLSLIVIIIDGHPGQTFRLVEPVNHVLPLILKWHIWGYDSYQRAIPLPVEEWA